MQSTVEPEFMGRVLSVFTMVGSVMMPLGMLIFGPIADRINIDLMLIGTGIAIALLVIPFITSKVLREAGQAHLKAGEKHEDSNS
jgi:DHA3 family macrolide efflux protein-like MFS transporter